MIGPAIETPDLEDVESAGDHHVFLQPRELAQLRRDQDSAGAVDGALFRTGHHDADHVSTIRREERMLAEVLLEPLPCVEGKRRHAMISLTENKRVDAARDELFAIARGNTETTLRIDGVLVPASKHLTSPPSPGALRLDRPNPLPSHKCASNRSFMGFHPTSSHLTRDTSEGQIWCQAEKCRSKKRKTGLWG